MERVLTTKKYESPLSQKFADLQSIRRDLNKSIEMLNLLKPELEKSNENTNTTLIESIWSASVIRYCRCYASGKRYGLDETIFEGLPGDALGVHRWVKGMRDKLIAHSVNPFEECKTIIMTADEDIPKSWGIGFFDAHYAHPNLDGMANFCNLTVVLRDKVANLCNKVQSELQIEVNNLKPEELKNLPKHEYVAPLPEKAETSR